MSGPTLTSARQIVDRDILQQIFPNTAGQLLDELLRSIDKDLTAPLRADASAAPNLVVTVNSAIVNNTISNRQKSISHIGTGIPSFTSGTVTFPSTDGGTITASPGTTSILSCPSNNYVKILLSLDNLGNIIVTQGTPNVVEASALVPPSTGAFAFAYISLFNNAGTISNIQQNKIFQMEGGGGGGGFTNPMTNLGDMIYGGASGVATRLPFGQNGQSLEMSSGIPSWQTDVRTINAQSGTSYTFVLADGSNAGFKPLVTFSNASDTLVTVPPNSSVAFPVGTIIKVIQQGVGSVGIVGGVGVTVNSLLSSKHITDQYGEVTLVQIATDIWTMYGDLKKFIVATGGTITFDGFYKIHTFTTSGTFNVFSNINNEGIEYLVVAGGGGGGAATAASQPGGAGGGAGGLLHSAGASIPFAGASYTITVGAGGAGATGDTDGGSGGNSIIGAPLNITAFGGGGGGSYSTSQNGVSGGSGGGGAYSGSGGSGTVGQGNAGGNGSNFHFGAGGGGGGAGFPGVNATNDTGGGGGNGLSFNISGSSLFYAGGGGGSDGSVDPCGLGGSGGGANGRKDTNGSNGTANTGGGGGGAFGTSTTFNGGSGGSGVVIFRYQYQ